MQRLIIGWNILLVFFAALSAKGETAPSGCFELQFTNPPAYAACIQDRAFAAFAQKYGRNPAAPGNACIHIPPGPRRRECAAELARILAQIETANSVTAVPTTPAPPTPAPPAPVTPEPAPPQTCKSCGAPFLPPMPTPDQICTTLVDTEGRPFEQCYQLSNSAFRDFMRSSGF